MSKNLTMLFLKQTRTEISCHPEAIGYKVLNYVVRYLLEQYFKQRFWQVGQVFGHVPKANVAKRWQSTIWHIACDRSITYDNTKAFNTNLSASTHVRESRLSTWRDGDVTIVCEPSLTWAIISTKSSTRLNITQRFPTLCVQYSVLFSKSRAKLVTSRLTQTW